MVKMWLFMMFPNNMNNKQKYSYRPKNLLVYIKQLIELKKQKKDINGLIKQINALVPFVPKKLINKSYYKKKSLAEIACKYNLPSLLETLIKNGADISFAKYHKIYKTVKKYYGFQRVFDDFKVTTPLYYSLKYKNIKIFELLLKNNVDIDNLQHPLQSNDQFKYYSYFQLCEINDIKYFDLLFEYKYMHRSKVMHYIEYPEIYEKFSNILVDYLNHKSLSYFKNKNMYLSWLPHDLSNIIFNNIKYDKKNINIINGKQEYEEYDKHINDDNL